MNILEIASNYAGVINTVITERNTCLDYWQFTADQLEAFAKEIVEQSNSRWISVKDRLPEENFNAGSEYTFSEPVVVFGPCGATIQRFLNGNCFGSPTHWQPITPSKD